MKFDVFKFLEPIPSESIKNRLLDSVLDWAIPFNRSLGLHLEKLSKDQVVVSSPPRRRRKNHVGGAHACALALMGEYPAGLLLAQNYSPEQYRFIISQLNVEYHKQGRGQLTATALAPTEPAHFDENGQAWVAMQTTINNTQGELVATCHTKWQIKSWETVRSE